MMTRPPRNRCTLVLGNTLPAAVLACGPAAAGPPAFAPGTIIPTAAAVADLVLADLDGDGDLDIVSLEGRFGFPALGFLTVLLNHGDGTFAAPQVTELGEFGSLEFFVRAVAAGDLDDDGHVDVAFIGTMAPLTFMFGRGDGTLEPPAPTGIVADFGQLNALVEIADLDGDGIDDLAIGKPFRVVLNDGAGGLTVLAQPNAFNGDHLAIAELSGDAAPDLAHGARSHVNDGAGAFTETGVIPGGGAFSCAFADLDGDGDLDAACGRTLANELAVALNAGDATFGPSTANATETSPVVVASGEVNGDGDADIVVVHGGSANVHVFTGRGDGTLDAPVTLASPPGTALAVGDLNGDGLADLVLGIGSTQFGNDNGVNVVLNEMVTLTGDLDVDGDVDVVDFLALLSAWGACPGRPAPCPADLDGDGAVGVIDFLILLASFG